MYDTASTTIDRLKPSDFRRLAAFIEDYSGIRMPPTKLTMLEGRLRHRMRDIGAASLADYCRDLFQEDGLQSEAVHLIDAVTTNKTDFFREPEHFSILVKQALPALVADRPAGPQAEACGGRPCGPAGQGEAGERGMLYRRRTLHDGDGAGGVAAASRKPEVRHPCHGSVHRSAADRAARDLPRSDGIGRAAGVAAPLHAAQPRPLAPAGAPLAGV